MSSVPISSLPPRKSFAQVAAAAHKPRVVKTQTPNPIKSSDVQDDVVKDVTPSAPALDIIQEPCSSETKPNIALSASAMKEAHKELDNDRNEALASSLEPGHAQAVLDGLPKRENSDTKSVASRTTLTLDEKESLRPDDSASVQAAVEEDSSSGSRVGSDPDARAFRDQLHEIERNGSARGLALRAGLPPAPSRTNPQIASGAAFSVPSAPSPYQHSGPLSEMQRGGGPPTGLALPPDEKLLEALASPKDRLFVLKIEQDMIDFVKDSKEQYLQLPQTNSFYRMLSHKLADYYCLNHIVDDSLTSVRIYRTAHCRLPPPLIGPDPNADGATPPPTALTRKIMRRGDEQGLPGSSGYNSRDPSKTTSELGAGSGGEDSKDKGALTREERESRYNEARARIFKDFKEEPAGNGEASPVQSNDKDLSRSSSMSGAKKNKKNRKPKDDGFEARSAYSQYGSQSYMPTAFQQPSTPNQSLYNAFANLNVSGPYNAMPAGYQQSPQYDHQGQQLQYGQPQFYGQQFQQHYPGPQQMSGQQPYTQQPEGFSNGPYNGYQGYPSPNLGAQSTPRPASSSLANHPQAYPPPPNQGGMWMQPQYPQGFQASNSFYGNPQGYEMMTGGDHGYHNYNSAHPDTQFYGHQSANAYGRPSFNPQIQAFIPGMPGGGPMPPQYAVPPQYGGNSARYQMSPAMQPMQRQPSNVSQASEFASPHMQGSPSLSRAYVPSSNRNQPQSHHGPSQAQSSISKWANSASLPSKPPPTASSLSFQVPRYSENEQPLPSNPMANTAISHPG